MVRRRVGERLRAQAKQRRRELMREHWPWLLLGTLGWAAYTALLVTWFEWTAGRSWAMAAIGFNLGLWCSMAFVVFRYVDPIGARISTGLDAEVSTADELRKLRRRGWRVVHNLHLVRGDVDHVAVGPGGVVVIESKGSSADWDFLERKGASVRWAGQAYTNGVRVRGLVQQHAKRDVRPVVIVVVWAPGQDRDVEQLREGVAKVKGQALAGYLRSLPASLDRSDVDAIAAALSAVSKGFDNAQGIVTPGRFARMLEFGR